MPKPLVPNPMNLMFVYIGRLGIEGQPGGRLEYLEAGIGVPAFHSTTIGNYAVCPYLDKAMPIVAGREVWGWPKKDAEVTFSEKDGMINGRVKRFGTVLLDASAKLETKLDPAAAPPEMPWFLQKIIPSVRKDASPEVWPLVSTLNADVRKKELWGGAAQLKLGTSEIDALGEIEVLQIVSTQFSVGDFDMDHGQVLHDYLAKHP